MMNTSFDDQASQSTTTDQQSEASSANAQSPRSSSAVYAANCNSNQTTTLNSHLMPQNYLNQESYTYPHSSSGYNSTNDVRNLQQQQQQQQQHRAAAAAGLNANYLRNYTGVDKLIMAAMLEDSAAAMAAASVTGYMPYGRGIGYLNHDSYAHQIPQPSNKSEIELYRLLERANLLNYFGTFLNFGGDDVQQLSDADEDEFLEIMSLVGMTQKPLHVRRLQKALIEWRENREAGISTFRKPASQSTNLCINNITQNTIHSQLNETLNSNQPIRSSPSMTKTSNTSETLNNNHQQQHYAPVPHEILVGAPKRLRLMDNLHRKTTTTAGNNSDNQQQQYEQNNTYHTNNNNTRTNMNQQPNANERNSLEQLPLSPSSQKSVDPDDDKLIEVMNSPQSDQEIDDDSTCQISGESTNATSFSYNKYGRYKASLRTSPNKAKPQ